MRMSGKALTIRAKLDHHLRMLIILWLSTWLRTLAERKLLNASEKAENIMSSPVLTRWHANQIIEACEPVASERFFYSERRQDWSLHEGRNLKKDKCKLPGGSTFSRGDNMCV
jgi:hypothetical protein